MPEPTNPYDTIHHTTETTLGWLDRLRVLFGRPIVVTSRIRVWIQRDGGPLRTESDGSSYVPPLLPHRTLALELKDGR